MSIQESSLVHRLCEELWNCHDPVPLLHLLQRLHLALRQEKAIQYDPSEAFLAIQGAALRFLPSTRAEASIDILHWTMTEEALLATATLCGVCVGPAWHLQRKYSRRFSPDVDQSTLQSMTEPPEDVIPDDYRSYSPLTDHHSEEEGILYPRIPEVLPAAVLRFAESILRFFEDPNCADTMVWKQRKIQVAVAQRFLVLALCCEDFGKPEEKHSNHDATARQWTIPGAHELVSEMVLFWLSLAIDDPTSNCEEPEATSTSSGTSLNNTMDSEIGDTLAASRATVDLVSTGWRPFGSRMETRVSESLLHIAKAGIYNLDPFWNEELRTDDDPFISKSIQEYLIALSSSAEAISALAAMGSRSLIPHNSEKDLTTVICHLHVRTRLVKASLMRYKENEAYRYLRLSVGKRQQFLNQVDSCFADTWELLLTLCSSNHCGGPMVVLLETVAVANPHSERCKLFSNEQWGVDDKLVCLTGGTALRVLSTAMWGSQGFFDIPLHLRSYMASHISNIREIVVSIGKIVRARIEDGTFSTQSTLDLLSLALDTVISIENFCTQQAAGRGKLISIVEWELFLGGVEEVFLPWFEYGAVFGKLHDDTSSTNLSQAIAEFLKHSQMKAQSLILRVGAMLDKFTRDDSSPFHSVVLYNNQKQLYEFILGKVIPIIEPSDGELLGLSVSRAWVKFGLFPFRLCDWFDTASDILKTMFSRKEDGRFNFSPNVRLATLFALENSCDQVFFFTSGENDTADARFRLSQIDITSERLGESSDYHSQITRAMIGVVEMSLKCVLSDDHLCLPQDPCSTLDELHGNDQSNLQSTPLRQNPNQLTLDFHLVRLAGIFVRDGSINRDRRVALLALIQWLASGPFGPHASSRKTFQIESSIRLEAARELERCLENSFSCAPFDAWMTPLLLQTCCGILATLREDKEVGDIESVNVCLFVLMVLARVRQGYSKGEIILLDQNEALADVPDDVRVKLLLLRHPPCRVERGANDLPVASNEECKMTSVSFDVNFTEIVNSFVTTLDSIRSIVHTIDDGLFELVKFVSLLSYNSLAWLWLAGASLGDYDTRLKFLASCNAAKTESTEETFFRSIAFGAFLQRRVAELSGQNHPFSLARGVNQDIDSMFGILLQAFNDDRALIEQTTISRAILAIIPSISQIDGGLQLITTLLERLVVMLDANQPTDKSRCYPILMEVGKEILMAHPMAIFEAGKLNFFEKCLALTKTFHLDYTSIVFHSAIRCMATTLELLPPAVISTLKQNHFQNVALPNCGWFSSGVPIVPGGDFAVHMVEEICDQLLFCANHSNSKCLSKDLCNISETEIGFTFLDKLAMDIEQIEQFEVEHNEQTGTKSSSIWFDGQCQLVTLRVGSSKSSFRGWVEVMIRSPTRRTRRLVRLPCKISLQDPHGSSSLWSHPSTVPPDATCYQIDQVPKSLMDSSTAKVQQKYESLVSRFDAIVGSPALEVQDIFIENNSLSVEDKGHQEIQGKSVESRQVVKRKLLYGENIVQWLICHLGDEGSAEAVLSGLQRMGFCNQPKKCFEKILKQLRPGQESERSIAVLDRIIPCNTHKVGLLYVDVRRTRPGDHDPEAQLLSNDHCSPAFHRFADRLGRMISTRNLRFFSGGLDASRDSDGPFTRAWVDEAPNGSNLPVARTIIVFHVPSLMPPGVINRKRHIGNDNVLIVFQDKHHDGQICSDLDGASHYEATGSVISGHFGFVIIRVAYFPEEKVARVTLRVRQGLPHALHQALSHFAGTNIVDMNYAPDFVRAMAVQSDLACRAMMDNLAPPSNVYERYKMLNQMGRHVK